MICVNGGQIDGLSQLLRDESTHPLPHYGIGCAYDNGIRSTWTAQQQGFDFFLRDIDAAPDEHIHEPPENLVICLTWACKLAFKASDRIGYWP